MGNSLEFNRRTMIRCGAQGVLATTFGATALHSAAPASAAAASEPRSIRDFGVSATATPTANRRHLQDAIDWASLYGAGLWVEPTDEPYAVESGLRLRQNVSLIGVHSTVPHTARHPEKRQPVGSVFRIESTDAPFIEVESATQLRGLQFWYPAQPFLDATKVIEYPATVQRAGEYVCGVALSKLAFFGEFVGIDFRSRALGKNGAPIPSELLLFEHCYGYPLSGRFIEIEYCYDIPRILHCHVNPANRSQLAKRYHMREFIDSVISRRTFCYSINYTDNAQSIDLFAFGVFGGVRLGAETYGQLTNFNLDCVTVGIHKSGSQQRNRNWQIAQGSIIANAGPRTEDLHPLIVDGQGHTSIANVECFAGSNPAVSSPTVQIDGHEVVRSHDFLLVEGNETLSVSLQGCRASNFHAEHPVTIRNPAAIVSAHGCFATRGEGGPIAPLPSGVIAH